MKITGKIVSGAGRGRTLGFPTINIAPCFIEMNEKISFGVYAVWVWLRGVQYKGAMNYGPRPTFNDMKPVLEVFILDYLDGKSQRTKDAKYVEYAEENYGEIAIIRVLKKIRKIQKFNRAENLQAQIEKDVSKVRQLLSGD